MANKMLIDATHPEETRVVVVRGDKVEEFDYESAAKKQLRGNIYLARVTRVEPSLQAAFVDYGGNRHGFLAFNEIHPDYYQIPVADRLHELEAEQEEARRARQAEEQEAEAQEAEASDAPAAIEEEGVIIVTPDLDPEVLPAEEDTPGRHTSSRTMATRTERVLVISPDGDEEEVFSQTIEIADENGEEDEIEELGRDDDAREELPRRPVRRLRNYKIQEVIKRKQVLLVQVVKEERGNKGAALTTYLSLAGRYTVLMPNTGRGGGISRKITNISDRKRLRKIADELQIPEGMGLIIRTAGASRTKADIKRDFEYLLRLWESIRELTLKSTAPTLVYEEGNLIKRAIRDLYDKGIDEVLVAGQRAYRQAKDFMRMLMPSHAKNVRQYKDPEPIFNRYQVERQLDAMFSPYVTLKSGGYIVINQTEALVSIDVNSGKSTKEHSIEETALATNLEAAEEIARQLRLRDLAGLIVIDFIDMMERRNNRAVERRMKESLKNDRARIQVGRISAFGLLEMSRQRLRSGVLEANTTPCPHCQGTGVIRSVESIALCVLRAIENKLQSGRAYDLIAEAPTDVALYLLNMKRPYLMAIEKNFGITLTISASHKLHGANFTVERDPNAPDRSAGAYENVDEDVIQMDWSHQSDDSDETAPPPDPGSEDGNERSRRRRRTRRARRSVSEEVETAENSATTVENAPENLDQPAAEEDEKPKKTGRSRRRGRRGGRRTRSAETNGREAPTASNEENAVSEAEASAPISFANPTLTETDDNRAEPLEAEAEAEAKPANETPAEPETGAEPKDSRRQRRGGRRSSKTAASNTGAPAQASVLTYPDAAPDADNNHHAGEPDAATAEISDSAPLTTEEQDEAPKPRRSRRRSAPTDLEDLESAAASNNGVERTEAETTSEATSEPVAESSATSVTSNDSDKTPKRRGWWQRR